MKKKLSFKETILVASTLFGMFFGAGNLIFPVHLGQIAGKNVLMATIGFCITAVSIPILGVASIGNTSSEDLLQLSSKVTKWYGVIFTTLLYLTIGPLFAIPRCATTSFTAGILGIIGENNYTIGQFIFSLIFFGFVLYFSLKPSGIITWIGKIINPIFLVFYLLLMIVALVNPSAAISSVEPIEAYNSGALFNGFIEGYGTMDAIAALAFGVVVVDIIKSLGINDEDDIAIGIIKSGCFTAIAMIVIYGLSIVMGTQSRGLFEISDNGGIALAQIAKHYLGNFGLIVLAITITFACLKTAIALVTSCSKIFMKMFNNKISYNALTIIFCVFSFVISNVGLTSIINYSLPVLMLLYPLAIVLIIIALIEDKFEGSKYVYICTIAFTFVPAFFDFLKTLPFNIDVSIASKIFPFYDLGFGWVVPSLIGFVLGIIIKKVKSK